MKEIVAAGLGAILALLLLGATLFSFPVIHYYFRLWSAYWGV